MARKTYSPIVYLRNPQRAFQGRDVTALLYLHPALAAAGYDLASPTLQSPLPERRPPPSSVLSGERLADFPAAEAADLLLLTSRPPLNDDPEFDKRALQRSFTWLENAVLDGLRSLLVYCSRREIRLAVPADGAPDSRPWQQQRFRIFVDRRVDRMAEYLDGESKRVIADTTAGYVLFHPALPNVGRPLLSVFGMSGDDTIRLAWALTHHPNCSGLLADMIGQPRPVRRALVIEIEKSDHPFNPLQVLDVDFRRVEVVRDACFD